MRLGWSLALLAGLASAAPSPGPRHFYVDPARGADANAGSIGAPFRTLPKALEVVRARSEAGILSDKIFLRRGVYRNSSTETVYHLGLKGRAGDEALISAMPCKASAPGCVERKSGRWYEEVVIDDGHLISTPWEPVPGRPHIWQTKPGYKQSEWGLYLKFVEPAIKMEGRLVLGSRGGVSPAGMPDTRLFALGPFMILQDGEPLIWEDSLDDLRQPGMRTYDQDSGTLYVRPIGDKDPKTCRFESWYAGPDRSELALLDGEGRALFDGSMEYVAIQGIEFRLFTKFFANHIKYESEEQRVTQRHVRVEDNLFSYGWIHMLLDVHGHALQPFKPAFRPRYSDRAYWLVRNNVFYRPSREVFQIQGDGHVFEHNAVIEHGGPWAGRAAIESIVNTRNTNDIRVRYNYILGHGNNKWHPGLGFITELRWEHQDETKDCRYGGQVFEHNVFANFKSGSPIWLGHWACRMRHITIAHNVFAANAGAPAIGITSPHAGLRIVNNVFYNQDDAIEVRHNAERVHFGTATSSIEIQGNIFASNRKTIDPQLLKAPAGSNVRIHGNLFFKNEQAETGTGPLRGDPLFRNPAELDFRLREGSAAAIDGPYLGAYDPKRVEFPGFEWWRFNGEGVTK
jgi:hypothetical protein